MPSWLKASLGTLGVCGIALVAWLLLGYTANFQKAPGDDPSVRDRDRTSASVDELTPDEQEALVTPDHPVDSPRGKFRASMTPIDDPEVRRFEVAVTELATGSRVVLEDELRARDNNFVLWDERDRLWIYSGDTGTTVWIDVKGKWESVPYTSDGKNEYLSLPDLLAKLRPALIKPESE